jgi:outer membrane protein OmpA-like peptidoglycan-associated protein
MKTILVSCLLLAPFMLMAQQKRYKLAEKLYTQGSYADAAQVYEDVLARGMDSVLISAHISESYDKSNNAPKAVEWYTFRYGKAQLDKEGCIRYSMLLCNNEDYQKAQQVLAFTTFKFGEDSRTTVLSKELERFLNKRPQDLNFSILTQNGNSDKSEMSVILLNESKALFSSTRNQRVAVRRYHALNNEPLYDLFTADVDSTGFQKVRRLNENTKYHDGSACLDSVNHLLYFTRNNYIDGKPARDANGNMLLKILSGKLVDGKLQDVVELPFNNNVYSCAHPSISADGKTLVFTSNMPGSLGGMDLFMVQKNESGQFGTPINMGSTINSAMDELFPFFHQQDKVLFFASNGHYGHGGLDIFAAKLNGNFNAKEVTNLGKPINSANDDFAFINDVNQQKGYITSNRTGGAGDDDLYAFKQRKPIKSTAIVSGTVTDLLTGNKLDRALVVATDVNGVVIDSTYSDSSGHYEIELATLDADFTLTASKANYLPATKTVVYDPNKENYEENIQLIPDLDYFISGIIRDKDTRATLADVSISITDLMSSQELFKLRSNESGAFVTDTLIGKDYGDTLSIALTLEKKGYLTITYTLKELLALKEEIVVNALIDPVMSKITIGTDLANLVDLRPIYYDYRKWNIRQDAATELNKIVKVMLENPNMVIELGSHTDSRGDNSSNASLSDKRAKSAVDYIISKGIAKNRISAKGYGESKLLIADSAIQKMRANEEKERAHEKNRRTEFRVVKL